MNSDAFKAYDIRGAYPEQVNEELAYAVGRAHVRYLSAKQVVLGRDMRASSPALSAKLIEGITCEGADVIDIGECTTPMLNFAVAFYGYDGGVMVSASHNPAGDNAFKLIGKGAEMLDETAGLPQIKEMIQKGFASCRPGGAVTQKDILSDYLAHLLKFATGISDLKVVLDYGNGMGALSAKPLLARLDVNAVGMYEDPDGNFPNHPANPHDVVNFDDLCARVKKEKADLGIFFDGDADRALFVDELGQVVPIDLVAALLAQAELRDHPGERVYYDLRFTKSMAAEVKNAGGVPVMMRVGNPFYKRALKKDGGILGAEFSGHLMFAENYCIDDGLFATIKLMKLMCEAAKPLSTLISGVKKFEGSPEESMRAAHPGNLEERLKLAFPSARMVELDGTYLDFSDGFISVRQSKNEPELFRLRVEAKTADELKERLQKTREIVQG